MSVSRTDSDGTFRLYVSSLVRLSWVDFGRSAYVISCLVSDLPNHRHLFGSYADSYINILYVYLLHTLCDCDRRSSQPGCITRHEHPG